MLSLVYRTVRGWARLAVKCSNSALFRLSSVILWTASFLVMMYLFLPQRFTAINTEGYFSDFYQADLANIPKHPFDPGQPKMVVLLGYQRVGSTFTGQVFNQNPEAVYVFEPVDGVFSAMYGIDQGWTIPTDIAYHWNGSERIEEMSDPKEEGRPTSPDYQEEDTQQLHYVSKSPPQTPQETTTPQETITPPTTNERKKKQPRRTVTINPLSFMGNTQDSQSGYAFPYPAPPIECPDLTEPDDFDDVTISVEDQKLYTCKGILASASPVWRRMFLSDFKESSSADIPLPGKNYDEIYELLLCISPAIQKPITGENVANILPLADEYQMVKLKLDCENWLLCQLEGSQTLEQYMRYLAMAHKYNLERLLERCVDQISRVGIDQLEKQPGYEELEQETVIKIMRKRVQALEKVHIKQKESNEMWRQKCEDLEDCLKKMSKEKLIIKKGLDQAEGAWDLKSPDTRCIDAVHIYGPRNYECDKCTRQVHTYVQSKLHYLLNKGSAWSGVAWPK